MCHFCIFPHICRVKLQLRKSHNHVSDFYIYRNCVKFAKEKNFLLTIEKKRFSPIFIVNLNSNDINTDIW